MTCRRCHREIRQTAYGYGATSPAPHCYHAPARAGVDSASPPSNRRQLSGHEDAPPEPRSGRGLRGTARPGPHQRSGR